MSFEEKYKEYLIEWKKELLKHKSLISLSFLFLILAIITNFYAGSYADAKGNGSAAVSDIILDFIPAIDLTYIFVTGYILVLTIFFIYPFFFRIKNIHIIISQFSLLMMVRNFFLILTHLKVPTDAIDIFWPGIFSN